MTDEAGKASVNPVANFVTGLVKLDWIRPLLYKIGGRKVAVGGGALAVVSQIAASNMADWPKAIACLSVALIAALTSVSIGIEDGAEKGAPQPAPPPAGDGKR